MDNSKNILSIVSLAILTIGPLICGAQTSSLTKQNVGGLRLGMTQAQVHAKLGAPHSYYMTLKHYPVYPRIVIGPVLDSYMRTVHGRQYEIQLMYEIDENGPRIHPTQRLIEIFLLADRREPARTLLADFIEAVSACRSGCDLFGGGPGDSLQVRQRDKNVEVGPPITIEISNLSLSRESIGTVNSLDDLCSQAMLIAGSLEGASERIGEWQPK